MKSLKKVLALTLVLSLALAGMACAKDYPKKDIYVICPWGAGGGTDACLRALCTAMSSELGVTLTVDNITGGGGILGHQAIANVEPDGYSIGMITFELSTYSSLGTELTWENYDLLGRVNTDAAALSVNAKWAADNGIKDLASISCLARSRIAASSLRSAGVLKMAPTMPSCDLL